MRASVLQGTDAGLVAIGARFGAAAGFGLGLGPGGEAAAAEALGMPRRMLHNPVRQVPIVASALSGSGTINGQSGWLGPPTGHYWSIRDLGAVGFTAGTVTFSDTAGQPGQGLAVFQGATVVLPQFFAKGQILMHPGHYLVIVAAGITGTVTISGDADQFPAWYLSEYLA